MVFFLWSQILNPIKICQKKAQKEKCDYGTFFYSLLKRPPKNCNFCDFPQFLQHFKKQFAPPGRPLGGPNFWNKYIFCVTATLCTRAVWKCWYIFWVKTLTPPGSHWRGVGGPNFLVGSSGGENNNLPWVPQTFAIFNGSTLVRWVRVLLLKISMKISNFCP